VVERICVKGGFKAWGERVRELHRVAYKYEHIIKFYLKILSHRKIMPDNLGVKFLTHTVSLILTQTQKQISKTEINFLK